MRRSSSEVVTRLCTIALLSALGFVLMAFLRIPYPPAPWLMIEFSDVVVLIAYAMYGMSGGLMVSIFKTLLDMAVHGLTGAYGIGNITAFVTSLFFVLTLFLASHLLKLFKKGLPFRILGYLFITILVATLLTLLNALFITPTYLTGTFTTCFDSQAVQSVIDGFNGMGIKGNVYFLLIFIIYFPFNLLKGACICAIYELIFNRLIFVLMERSPKMKKYFLGSIFIKKENIEDSDKNKEEDTDKTAAK